MIISPLISYSAIAEFLVAALKIVWPKIEHSASSSPFRHNFIFLPSYLPVTLLINVSVSFEVSFFLNK